MTRFRLDGLRPNYETGDRTGNLISKIANEASNFACGLYADYPGAVVPNAGDDFLRGVWDSLCNNRQPGLPPPPTPTVNGGQCEGVRYRWVITSTFAPRDAEQIAFAINDGKLSIDVSAPIEFPGTDPPTGRYPLVVYSNGVEVFRNDYGVEAFMDSAPTLDTFRADGNADICGNGVPDWPTKEPPPTGWETGDIVVNNNDGTDLTLPIVYAPITGNLNAEFALNVDDLILKFDLGGIEVNIGNDGNSGDGYKDIDDKLDDIIERLPSPDGGGDGGGGGSSDPPTSVPPPTDIPPASNPDLDANPKEPTDPKEEDNITDLRYVCVNLTKLPDKTQFGNGSPDVHFAGWFEFKSGNCCFPRQPINFIESLFPAPPGADGYAYTLTNGAEGSATIYTRKPETNA